MENVDVARIFWDIAEFLDLKQDNPFKIRAYQKAAQNIESLSENVETIYKRGGLQELQEVPGIGERIAQKIEQIIKTGKLDLHQKLLKEFPKTLIEMMKLHGVGPRSAMLFYKKLKISNIEALEKAAKAHKLRKLAGMGAKKEESILHGIDQYRKRKGLFILSVALPYAQAIVDSLEKLKEVNQILPSGSLRRMKETIGDIDILVTSKKPDKVMDTFVSLPQVAEVVAKGHTKSTVILKCGLQADIRVVAPESFGAAAHYFTGSKQHNIRIRERGVKRGLKINEYGVFKGAKRIGGRKEEDIFSAVGLPFIPPELREGTGEVEAAEKGKLPKLIEYSKVRGDLHAHTKDSDGGNTIEEMAEAAKQMGWEYLGICDHSKSMGVAGGLSDKELLNQIKRIDRLNKKLKGIHILKGNEVDIRPDGTLDYKDDILKQLDLVVAAVHSKFGMDRESMTKRICSAMKNKYVNILAHPTGRLLGKREPYPVDLDKVIQVAKDTGTYIELNCFPERLDLDDIHCRKAKQSGVLIALATDAHHKAQLEYMKFGVAIARRGWLEAKNILNTFPLAKLLKMLYAKR